MLLGLNTKKPAAPAGAETENIFNVSTAEFETKILGESQKRPVLIDFWAPWCGPCKQLMPVLEELVNARQGKVALAKVNIDENPELAQAFRVQSVPTVIAFYMGQPVSGFTGVRPRAEIENLLAQMVQLHQQNQPEALDIPAVLKAAAEAVAENNFSLALNLFSDVLNENPLNAAALSGMMRVLITQGDTEQARVMLSNLPEQVSKDPQIASVRTMLDLLAAQPAGGLAALEEALSKDPQNPQLLFDYAEAAFGANEKDKAVDALVALIRSNRQWEDEKARLQLLKYFEAWGVMDPASIAGRRKLSSQLFS